MNKTFFLTFLAIIGCGCMINAQAVDSLIPLRTAQISQDNKSSLQRGARNFMNYCSGCHALHLVSYQHIADGLGLNEEHQEIFKKSIIYPMDKFGEQYKMGAFVTSGFTVQYGSSIYGTQVPDLSLASRVRGKNWLYTYLLTFYEDETRPTGFNNLVFNDVAMPNPFWELQGTQALKEEYTDISKLHLAREPLDLKTPGLLSKGDFQLFVEDIVNFLVYVGDPSAAKRKDIGYWVVAFMILFTVLTYFLHLSFWRDVEEKE